MDIKPRPNCRRCHKPIDPEPKRATFAVRIDGKMIYFHHHCALAVLADVIREDAEKRNVLVDFRHGGFIA